MRRTIDHVKDGVLKAPRASLSMYDVTKDVLTEEMVQKIDALLKRTNAELEEPTA